MDSDEFRRAGYAIVDWIARYLETVGDLPVRSPAAPGEVAALLPPSAPRQPELCDDVLADLDRVVVPGLTHWQHPRFFAYFPSNTSHASILGDLVSSGLSVNGMSWATSPACTEVEQVMCDWMAELLGLPEVMRSTGPGGGVIQDSASSATLCAIVAARERATGGATNRAGGPAGLVAYATAQGHSSVEKGLRIAGVGAGNLRLVDTDASYAMEPGALEEAMAEDRSGGRIPFLVVATSGTTSSLAFDPVSAIADVCHRQGAWLHVDAAMSGIAALCPEHRWVVNGVEGADSWCTNPHKWMGVNFDCDLFYVRDRRPLIDALTILPEYLRTDDGETLVDYRDWQIPLGRRFRALKLWFTLRLEGVESVREMIRRHVALTDELAAWVAADDHLVPAAPHHLNLLCLRHAAGDAATDRLIESANASGTALFTRTVLNGRSVLRFCVGSRTTTRADVEKGWALLRDLAAAA